MRNPITAELDETGTRIALHNTMWAHNPLIKEIPGKRYESDMKRWTLPLSWAACLQARAVFGHYDPAKQTGLAVGPALAAWARTEKQRRTDVLELRELQTFEGVSPMANAHDDVLYPFQIPGRDFLVKARHALLGDEMGSGKTLQTLAALRAVPDGYPALVVCPNSVKRNWAREVRRWLPEATPCVIDGGAVTRRKQLAAAAETERAVVIMNIESIRLHSRLAPYGSVRLKRCIECDAKHGDPELKTSQCEVHEKELNNLDFRVCVLDEAHRVKNPRALQSRAIWQVFHAPSVAYRWALTGTPVANHPGDLWSIMHTVSPETFPAKSAFIDRYADTELNPFGGMEIKGLKPGLKEEFFSIVDPHFRRMIKASVLSQLPQKVYVRRDVVMSPKQRKIYDSTAGSMIAELDDGTKLVADGNLAAATRLIQFASAYCEVDKGETPDDPKTWNVTLTDPSPKVDELMAIIEDNPGKPLAIAAEHRQLIDLAAKRLTEAGIRFGRITGGVSAAERDASIEAFQSGKIDYLLFTYKAGGVGLNMTRADTLVRLQRSWSMVDNKQGEDRIHRIGSEQHDSITIIDLVTADTIEESQLETLYAKAERLEEVVRDRAQLVKLGTSTDEIDAMIARLESSDLMRPVDVDTELTKAEVHADAMIDGGP